jgi:hypothetical protein
MTEEPHYPQPQGDAATARRASKIAPKLAHTSADVPNGMPASGRDARMEEMQYIPGGRIRLWSDGTITVSLGAIHG